MSAPVGRVLLPEELAEEVRDGRGAFRRDVERDDVVLVLHCACERNAHIGHQGVVLSLGGRYRILTVDFVDGHCDAVKAWALVGSSEAGPRPDVGGRVLVLDVQFAEIEGSLIGYVGEVGLVEGDTGRVGVELADGSSGIATRWALLPPAVASEDVQGSPGGSGDAEPGEDVSPKPLRNACPSVHPHELGVDCMSFEGHPGGSHAAVVDGETLVWVDEEIHESSPRRSLVEALMGDREVEPYVPRPVPERRPWRLGESWLTAGGRMVTVVEVGAEPLLPGEHSRRSDDRLLFAADLLTAQLLVAERGDLLAELASALARVESYRSRLEAPCGECRAPALEAALTGVVNTLGPLSVCDCAVERCGLHDEAAEALRIAREALGVETP